MIDKCHWSMVAVLALLLATWCFWSGQCVSAIDEPAPIIAKRLILLPDGKPAAGATVRIQPPQSKELTVKCDENGLAIISIPGNIPAKLVPIHTYLIVTAPHCALTLSLLEYWMPENNSPEPLQLLPEDQGHKIAGKFVDYRDTPIAGAQVKIDTFTEGSLAPRDIAIPEFTTTSGPAGEFSFPSFAIDREWQLFQAILLASTKVNGKTVAVRSVLWLNDAAAVKIVYIPSFTVAGKVVDAVSQKPIPDAEVYMFDQYSRIDSPKLSLSSSDKNGLFLMKDVEAAAKLIAVASHAGYQQGGVVVSQDGASLKDPRSIENVVIRLLPLVKVSGQVLDATSGKPAIVQVQSNTSTYPLTISDEYPETMPGWGPGSKGIPNSHPDLPRFVLETVAGHNNLKVYSNSYDFFSEEFEAVPGQQLDLIIKLHRKKGNLLHIDTKSIAEAKEKFSIEVRESAQDAWKRKPIVCADIMLGAKNWGDKRQVRIVRKDDGQVVLPEQEVIADESNWVVTLPVN